MDHEPADAGEILITLTANIVVAHLTNNSAAVEEVPALIRAVHTALSGLGSQVPVEQVHLQPAVSIRASVRRDHLVCLEDGKKMKMLKRHIMTEHGMTPDEYRRRWGLPAHYPMIAADHAEARRDLAVRSGLGREPHKRGGRRKAES